MTTVEEMYGNPNNDDDRFYEIVNRSLAPRSPEMLFEEMAAFGLPADALILDAGCRDGKHTARLVEQLGVQAIGIDLVRLHVERAQQLIREKGLAGRLTAVQGDIQDLPLAAEQFDAIWCRDVLSHMQDLHRAVGELARVLRKNGRLLIYQTFATDRLEPNEAGWLFDAIATVPRNMNPAYLEAGLEQAGFRVDKVDHIRSEWREQWEETGIRHTSQQLLRIARMVRNRETLIAQVGESAYLVELADCHWGVYQMLGKLCLTLYIATKQ